MSTYTLIDNKYTTNNGLYIGNINGDNTINTADNIELEYINVGKRPTLALNFLEGSYSPNKYTVKYQLKYRNTQGTISDMTKLKYRTMKLYYFYNVSNIDQQNTYIGKSSINTLFGKKNITPKETDFTLTGFAGLWNYSEIITQRVQNNPTSTQAVVTIDGTNVTSVNGINNDNIEINLKLPETSEKFVLGILAYDSQDSFNNPTTDPEQQFVPDYLNFHLILPVFNLSNVVIPPSYSSLTSEAIVTDPSVPLSNIAILQSVVIDEATSSSTLGGNLYILTQNSNLKSKSRSHDVYIGDMSDENEYFLIGFGESFNVYNIYNATNNVYENLYTKFGEYFNIIIDTTETPNEVYKILYENYEHQFFELYVDENLLINLNSSVDNFKIIPENTNINLGLENFQALLADNTWVKTYKSNSVQTYMILK